MRLTIRYVTEDKTCGKHFYTTEPGASPDMFAPGGTTTCLSCTCCTCAAVGVTPFTPANVNAGGTGA